MHKKMDIVITWVDGSDEAWLAERKKYETKGLSIDAVGDRRFRDWGFLKYWFRGIEQNAPFAKNIYFVTYGHIPDNEIKLYYDIVAKSRFRMVPCFALPPSSLIPHSRGVKTPLRAS